LDDRRTKIEPNPSQLSRLYEWNSMKHSCEIDVESEDNRGTIEAGLVIIPTTLLFLMILQIIFAGSLQIVERAKLHNLIIESSLAEVSGDHNGTGESSLQSEKLQQELRRSFLPIAESVLKGRQRLRVNCRELS